MAALRSCSDAAAGALPPRFRRPLLATMDAVASGLRQACKRVAFDGVRAFALRACQKREAGEAAAGQVGRSRTAALPRRAPASHQFREHSRRLRF